MALERARRLEEEARVVALLLERALSILPGQGRKDTDDEEEAREESPQEPRERACEPVRRTRERQWAWELHPDLERVSRAVMGANPDPRKPLEAQLEDLLHRPRELVELAMTSAMLSEVRAIRGEDGALDECAAALVWWALGAWAGGEQPELDHEAETLDLLAAEARWVEATAARDRELEQVEATNARRAAEALAASAERAAAPSVKAAAAIEDLSALPVSEQRRILEQRRQAAAAEAAAAEKARAEARQRAAAAAATVRRVVAS